MSTSVTTGKVRASYAHVFKAHAHEEGQTPKYSLSIIIPKDDKKTIKKIEAAIKAATEQGKSKWSNKIPKNLKLPLRDGDEEKEDDENYENAYFLNCSSTRKPTVIDREKEELFDDDDFYSGCYCRVALNFYAFNVSGNKGIAVGLQHTQKLDDGDRLGGAAISVEDAFGEDFDDDLM